MRKIVAVPRSAHSQKLTHLLGAAIQKEGCLVVGQTRRVEDLCSEKADFTHSAGKLSIQSPGQDRNWRLLSM